MQSKPVFITGGTGFLGSYVAKQFVKEGYEPWLFDIAATEEPLRKHSIVDDVTIVEGDITDVTALYRTIKDSGATHIVHLAALLLDLARSHPGRAIDVNIKGTHHILEAARTFDDQIERVVCASTNSVFARSDEYQGTLDEDSLADSATLYGSTKIFCEKLGGVYYEDYDVPFVALRPQIIYGPYRKRGASKVITDMIERSAIGEPVSVNYGEQQIDWHFAEDVAEAFVKATFVPQSRLNRRIYTLAGTVATVRETAALIEEMVPEADIDVSDDGTLPFTADHDMTKAQRDLDYEPSHSLKDGLKKYINQIRTENGLPPIDA